MLLCVTIAIFHNKIVILCHTMVWCHCNAIIQFCNVNEILFSRIITRTNIHYDFSCFSLCPVIFYNSLDNEMYVQTLTKSGKKQRHKQRMKPGAMQE